jgi:hypothetical protein
VKDFVLVLLSAWAVALLGVIQEQIKTYPTRVGIQKPPPYAVSPDLLHAPAAVEEHSQHALSEVDDLLVLLRVGGVGRVVGHGMLLWNRWNDKGGM